jgi:hypothetical protein
MLPPRTTQFVRVMPRSQPEIWTNVRILLVAALLGLFLGSFQSLTLSWSRFKRAAWMFATTLGVVFSAGVLLMVPLVATYLRVSIHPWRLILDHHPGFYYGGSAALCVSILGMIQTPVLARRNPRVLVWIPASAIGVFACGSVVALAPVLPFLGFVYGVLTVLPLEWILRPRIAHDAVPVGSSDLPESGR